jgi:hypothetical protein
VHTPASMDGVVPWGAVSSARSRAT